MPRGRATASAVAVTTTVETVIATLNPISAPAGDSVDMDAEVTFTPGTAATAVTFQIRRGTTIAGTSVASTGAIACTAATAMNAGIQGTDSQAADVAGQQYVLTAQQTAATGNGTVGQCSIQQVF